MASNCTVAPFVNTKDFTVPKYIEWVVANARKFEEVELAVKGETDEELAASLVAEMLRTGLTRRM